MGPRGAGKKTMKGNLKLVVGLVAVIALAGCMGALTGDDGATDPAEYVPDNSDFIVHADMAVAQDDATQSLIDELAEADESTDAEEAEDFFEEFEDETGLDAREVNDLVMYGTDVGDFENEEFAFVLYADWAEDDLIESIEEEEDYEYTAVDTGDVTLYEPDVDDDYVGSPMYIAALDDGTFVLGDEGAVNEAVDVANGDADAVEGEMRDVFDSMDDGYLTFVYDLDEEEVPNQQAGAGVNLAVFEDVSVVGGTYATDGDDSVSVRVHMHADNDEAAEDIVDVTKGGLTFYVQELEQVAEETEDEELADMAEEIDSIEVEQDGDIVVITYESSVDDLADLLDEDGPAV